MNQRTPIDYRVVEEGAAKGFTRQKLADTLGISYPTLYQRFKDDPHVMGAWNRGLARRAGNGGKPADREDTSNNSVAKHKVLAALLHGPRSLSKIADAAGMSYSLVVETVDELENEGRVRENEADDYEKVPDDEQLVTPIERVEKIPNDDEEEHTPIRKPRKARKVVDVHKTRKPRKAATKRKPGIVDVPVVHVGAEPVVQNNHTDLKEAVLVELMYARLWGEVSPKFDEVVKRLRSTEVL